MTDADSPIGRYLAPGTPVKYDGLVEGGAEYGVVVHCWLDDEIPFYDCYVAFFGDRRPTGRPSEAPCILRYASTSLTVLDPARS